MDSYAILHDIYKFEAKAGATYDVFSTSYLDPFLLRIYDSAGNTIVANDEADDGPDMLLSGAYYSNDIIWNWVAPYDGTYYVAANWHQGSYNKFYALSLYEDVDTIPVQQTTFFGSDINDNFNSSARNEFFYGYGGVDTVNYTGMRSSYTLTKNYDSWTVSSVSNGVDKIFNVERLKFADKIIALDIDGVAGQAYRIYQAAFDRKPDNDGLRYWISQMDNGKTQQQVADGFISSSEFSQKYGLNPSNADFLTKIYNNVLHRAPDKGGYDWWLSNLNSGQNTKAEVLSGFAESPENQAGVIGVISNGIEIFL
ncbi:DUF4214 domain-containing protein [Simplicispira psychrophila]|uniref:DUF4214 domain-containing protein n=1 Tax=Simplicispira psychrophila TaxID=80882 RepID=UPI000A052E1D|nr:DUF4214 domain-containing protein [Simplicispira psychrophila]